ncbi:MAG: sorbosone dehydrogenase family protein [Anaerolineales bacterium]|nr:sorbosone dehydrogenase family protein [Anaerolineales bacterium]
MQHKSVITIYLAFAISLAACTLRFGGPNKLSDAPAPTAIPLQTTAEPTTPAGLTAPPGQISLPPGFAVAVFASGLKNPRMMAFGPDGYLHVAERGEGRIVRLPDQDQDGVADEIQLVTTEKLNRPNSLAFDKDGSMVVGEVAQVQRFSRLNRLGFYQAHQVIIDNLPEGGHNTRTVLFSPDWSELYVSIGSSCNVCEEKDIRRATIMRYNPDGSGGEVFAHGLRNAVGLTFRPGTNELWATNNGRDQLGDDLPPDTVQRVSFGLDFGWPVCHAGRIVDPEFGNDKSCDNIAIPEIELQAHSAPLGLVFYAQTQFPEEYQGNLFVAMHGSWNRSTPTGYKIVRIPFANDQPGAVMDFASGWLVGQAAWGRPVDLAVGPDGSLFVSDDAAGTIYRIFYIGTR